MPSPIYSVGVDLGGTWIRLQAVDSHKYPVRSFKASAPSLAQLPAVLKRTLKRWNCRPAILTVASRGVWSVAERGAMKRALYGLAQRIHVMSDVEAAWFASFSSHHQGVMVIAGTGSIAYGRDVKGRAQRAGGWGPLLGDEGSAFWIGKTWIQRSEGEESIHRILKLVRHSHQAVRKVAALTPHVLKQAQAGHPIAKGIIMEGQSHLAALVKSIIQRLRLKNPVPVSWGGSLLDNEIYRKGVAQALKGSRMKFHWVKPQRDAASAVAHLFSHER